jgi:8-oxo-dGTP pyrophosphatase MutT (NUDIX family)
MTEQPYLVELNPGYFEYQLPISIKAVIIWNGRVPLLQNERDEWELPGGKLEVGESPQETLAREIEEELGWSVAVEDPIHAWVYPIRSDRHVFVVAYRATYTGVNAPTYSHEHKALTMVELGEVRNLNMPEDYKIAIGLASLGPDENRSTSSQN